MMLALALTISPPKNYPIFKSCYIERSIRKETPRRFFARRQFTAIGAF